MGLIDGIIYESNYFISVYEALGLVADHTNENLEDVAIYLDGYWLSVFVPVYQMNALHHYRCTDRQKFNDFTQTSIFESTYEILHEMAEIKIIEDDLKFTVYAAFRDKYAKYYWLRHDFFKNESISKLGLIDDLAELQTDNIYLDERKAEAERLSKVNKIINEHEQVMVNENAKLKAEIERLKEENIALNNEFLKLRTGSETNSNSQLLLISTLFAKYKADKPRVRTQDKTLKDIEEENISISGLSFSQTSKIMAIANNLYKQMKNIK